MVVVVAVAVEVKVEVDVDDMVEVVAAVDTCGQERLQFVRT